MGTAQKERDLLGKPDLDCQGPCRMRWTHLQGDAQGAPKAAAPETSKQAWKGQACSLCGVRQEDDTQKL